MTLSFLCSPFRARSGSLADELKVRTKISPQEADFLRSYAKLTAQTKEPFLDVFDPFSCRTDEPPKEIMCNVKVVRECGTVQTESGMVDFRKGMRFRLVRSEVERLIMQGYLEVVP